MLSGEDLQSAREHLDDLGLHVQRLAIEHDVGGAIELELDPAGLTALHGVELEVFALEDLRERAQQTNAPQRADVHDIEYAYVVFDEGYASAREALFAHLEGLGIRSCGRYGAWIYNSMEDSILAGMEAAQWLSS